MKSNGFEEVVQVQRNSENVFMTEDETSSFLKMSKRTLQAWRVQGRGPKFIKVGRSIRYRLGDLERFMAENVRQSTILLNRKLDTLIN